MFLLSFSQFEAKIEDSSRFLAVFSSNTSSIATELVIELAVRKCMICWHFVHHTKLLNCCTVRTTVVHVTTAESTASLVGHPPVSVPFLALIGALFLWAVGIVSYPNSVPHCFGLECNHNHWPQTAKLRLFTPTCHLQLQVLGKRPSSGMHFHPKTVCIAWNFPIIIKISSSGASCKQVPTPRPRRSQLGPECVIRAAVDKQRNHQRKESPNHYKDSKNNRGHQTTVCLVFTQLFSSMPNVWQC